jgi:hypothetical protein
MVCSVSIPPKKVAIRSVVHAHELPQLPKNTGKIMIVIKNTFFLKKGVAGIGD